MRPEPVALGTVVVREIRFATELTAWFVKLNLSLLLVGMGSKFAPVTVTGVPAVPMLGAKLVIVGAFVPLVTVNDEAEVAEPFGAVMLMVPGGAPPGRLATICL